MLKSSVYINAAKLIDNKNHQYTCNAINHVVDSCSYYNEHTDAYAKVMSPDEFREIEIEDFEKRTEHGDEPHVIQLRVLTLLMMAEATRLGVLPEIKY